MNQMEEALKKSGGLMSDDKGNKLEKKPIRQEESNTPPTIVFRDTNGYLRRELLTNEADIWAGLLFKVSSTQLRSFYNEVKAIQSRIEVADEAGQNGFKINEALIGLLKSKVAYARAKAKDEDAKAFGNLQKMIEQGADLSTSAEAYKDFALFFEAVLGFHKGR